ncbi:MAG: hypothetical protein KDA77_02700, partial [Planctomycetaceae bacterium]|nr:hypothetical protein [Planctomycetaceae bacterium]
MNDRTHFFLSCSITVVMIAFVLWLKYPAPVPLQTAQETPIVEAAPLNLQRFLDAEEGSATALINHPLSAEFETVKRKQYIPLNVVPQQKKQQSNNKQNLNANRAVGKQHAISSQQRRQLQQTETHAGQLVDQSTDAFSRGLLSLSEYQLALNIGFETKLKAAEIRQIKKANITLLNEKQELFQRAVEQLQAFNQPAAQGWYGDLVHARLLLAQNQYEIANISQNVDLQRSALAQISKLSNEYFAIRKVELDVGEADLSEFRRASRSVYVANQERQSLSGSDKNDPRSLAEYVRELEEIQSEVEWMAERGAGLGRSDLLNLSQAHL